MYKTYTVLQLYTDDTGSAIPSFDSDHLPSWWSSYGGDSVDLRRINITVNPAAVGLQWEEALYTEQVIVASGDVIEEAFRPQKRVSLSYLDRPNNLWSVKYDLIPILRR